MLWALLHSISYILKYNDAGVFDSPITYCRIISLLKTKDSEIETMCPSSSVLFWEPHSVNDPMLEQRQIVLIFIVSDVQQFKCFSTHYLQMSSHYFIITYSSGPDRLVNAICWPKNIPLQKLRIRSVNCIRPLKKFNIGKNAVTVDWVSLSFPLDAFSAAISIWIFFLWWKNIGNILSRSRKRSRWCRKYNIKIIHRVNQCMNIRSRPPENVSAFFPFHFFPLFRHKKKFINSVVKIVREKLTNIFLEFLTNQCAVCVPCFNQRHENSQCESTLLRLFRRTICKRIAESMQHAHLRGCDLNNHVWCCIMLFAFDLKPLNSYQILTSASNNTFTSPTCVCADCFLFFFLFFSFFYLSLCSPFNDSYMSVLFVVNTYIQLHCPSKSSTS